MDMVLRRKDGADDGIFGELASIDGFFLCATLEHAYEGPPGGPEFVAKLPAGVYTCVRGIHRLAHMANTFETFEITGVLGHTNILFHVGNYNGDSAGCVLLGDKSVNLPNGMRAITCSREAFADFLDFQEGFDAFQLTVE